LGIRWWGLNQGETIGFMLNFRVVSIFAFCGNLLNERGKFHKSASIFVVDQG
jgi:hypothetical protein